MPPRSFMRIPARLRVLGLTGSIGMGKTTAARMLQFMNVPVFSADHCVHRLLAPGGRGVAAVESAFPGTARAGGISRPALAERVFGNDPALDRLESVLHPLVRDEEINFLHEQGLRGRKLAVLEIPLLYETGGDALCDIVAVVSAPRFVQESRVLARPGMTYARLAAIRSRQMPDSDKRRAADRVIPTGLGRRETFVALARLVNRMRRPDIPDGSRWAGPSRLWRSENA